MNSIRFYVLVFLCIVCRAHSLTAQEKEGSVWFFGPQLGVSFQTGQLATNNTNQYNNLNITAAMADSAGNLLFHTDGTTVFDRNNTIMPNGAGMSGARMVGVVPKPNTPHRFYIIGISNSGRMWYSEIDMTLNNGLGDVAVGQKNQTIVATEVAPKLTMILHSNGTDIWLISHEIHTNRYITIPLTPGGFGAPLRIAFGRTYCDRRVDTCGSLGIMKSAPNGQWIADPLPVFSEIQMLSFNNTTGAISDFYTLDTEFTLVGNKRSVGFSPNSRYLYEGSDRIISQYDLNAGSEANIQASKLLLTNISADPAVSIIDFQLAIDGKLYFIQRGNPGRLGVIRCPNLRGAASNISTNAVTFGTTIGTIDGFAPQPNFFFQSTALQLNASATRICLGDTVQLDAWGGGIETFTWSPSSSLQGSNTLQPIAIPTANTTYTLNASDACGNTFTRAVDIQVIDLTGLTADSNSPVTGDDTIELEANGIVNPAATYLWEGPNGFTSTLQNPSISNATFAMAGTYRVAATLEGCQSDTATVEVEVLGEITLQSITDAATASITDVFCPNQELAFTYDVKPNLPFEGIVELSDSLGSFAQPTPLVTNVNLFNQNTTGGETLTFTLPPTIAEGSDYRLRLVPDDDSLYTVFNNVNAFRIEVPRAQAMPDTVLCNLDSLQLRAAPLNANETGRWELLGGEGEFVGDVTNPEISVRKLGEGDNLFVWEIQRGSCLDTDTVQINVVRAKANLLVHSNRTLCQGDTAVLSLENFYNNNIQWYKDGTPIEGATADSISVDSSGVYFAVASTELFCTDTSKQITVTVLPAPEVSLAVTDTIRLCPGSSFLLQADTANADSVQWQKDFQNIETATASSLQIVEQGAYRAIAWRGACADTSQIVHAIREGIVMPMIFASDTLQFCPGTTALLQADSLPNLQYQWLRDTVAIPEATAIQYSTAQAGLYSLVVNNGVCTDTSRAVVVLPYDTLRLAYPDSIAVCSATSRTVSSFLQQERYEFMWEANLGIDTTSLESPIFQLNTLVDTTITYHVTVRDTLTDCLTFDSVKVTFLALPLSSAGGNRTLCSGDSTRLGAEPLSHMRYRWYPSDLLSDSTTARPTWKGKEVDVETTFQYVLEVTDTLRQCINTDTVRIQVVPEIRLALPPQYAVCSGDTLTMGVAPFAGVSYRWQSSAEGIVLPDSSQVAFSWNHEGLQPDTLHFVLAAEAASCQTFDTTQVIIFPKPPIEKLQGDTLLCSNDVEKTYVLMMPEGNRTAWEVIGGTVLQVTDSTVQVQWAEQAEQRFVQATVSSPFGCVYPPQRLGVAIAPLPTPQLNIFTDTLCTESSVEVNYSLKNPILTSTYNWFIEGGEFLQNRDTSAVVRWLASEGRIWVQETDAVGCQASTDTFRVTIAATPKILAEQTEFTLCASKLAAPQTYTILPVDADSVLWEVTNGEVIRRTSTFIQIQWNSFPEKELRAIATSLAGCQADTLTFQINQDVAIPALSLVSWAEDNTIEVIIDPLAVPSELERSTDATAWETIAEVPANTSMLRDAPINLQNQPYFYRLKRINACSDTLYSAIHRFIVLQAQLEQRLNTGSLQWTPYLGWGDSLQHYQIWQQTIGNAFEFIGESTDTLFTLSTLPYTRELCYQIVAVHADGARQSFSNIECAQLSGEVIIPNVFTPNGDGRNDTWQVLNIRPNTSFSVKIMNRWGKIVFETEQPTEAWDGAELPTGAYFYQVAIGNRTFKGWIQLMR